MKLPPISAMLPPPPKKFLVGLFAALLAFAVWSFAAAPTPPPDLATLRARADAGDPAALNDLGTAYAAGSGVAQDFPEAARRYQAAADKGYAAAWFNLGALAELGRGQPADPAAAFKLYLKSAQLGYAPAQFNVGNMYASGAGIPQDSIEANAWFLLA